MSKAEGRSTLELFLHYFSLKSGEIKPHVVIGDNEQGIKTVAGNPDSIGYVSIGAAAYNANAGVPIKLLPMKGIAATTDHVRLGKFPLSRPLQLVTHGPAPPPSHVQALLDFARSEAVTDLVLAQSFVPPSSGPRP